MYVKSTDIGAVLLGVAYFVFAIWYQGGVLWEAPQPASQAPSYVVGADTLQAVTPLATVAAGSPDVAKNVGNDFRVLARVYALGEGDVSSKVLHDQITQFVTIRLEDGGLVPGSLKGFDDALTQARNKALGPDQANVTRDKAVEFLHGVAQALGG